MVVIASIKGSILMPFSTESDGYAPKCSVRLMRLRLMGAYP
jgi:hypothetical protein